MHWTLHTFVQHPKSNAKLGNMPKKASFQLHKLWTFAQVSNKLFSLDNFASNLFCFYHYPKFYNSVGWPLQIALIRLVSRTLERTTFRGKMLVSFTRSMYHWDECKPTGGYQSWSLIVVNLGWEELKGTRYIWWIVTSWKEHPYAQINFVGCMWLHWMKWMSIYEC